MNGRADLMDKWFQQLRPARVRDAHFDVVPRENARQRRANLTRTNDVLRHLGITRRVE